MLNMRLAPWFLITSALILPLGNNDGFDDRIIEGDLARLEDFPHQVSLRRATGKSHFCGGSLITPSHVLTAAHCMYSKWGNRLLPISIYVVAGQTELDHTSETVTRSVSGITIHLEYNKTTKANDVAILLLDRPFDLKEGVIGTIELANDFNVNDKCVVSGWGVETFKSQTASEILLATEVVILDRTVCSELYRHYFITDTMLCASPAGGHQDACQGDSGGPLTCNGLLTGVVSTGRRCGEPDSPGIYADVVNLSQWIRNNIRTSEAETNNDSVNQQNLQRKVEEFSSLKSQLENVERSVEYLNNAVSNLKLEIETIRNRTLRAYVEIQN